MYLHKDDRELFLDIINTVSNINGVRTDIIEKDYYVSLILKELILSKKRKRKLKDRLETVIFPERENGYFLPEMLLSCIFRKISSHFVLYCL